MVSGSENNNHQVQNPLIVSRALLSRLLSQSEVPLEVSLEELVISEGETTDDSRSETSSEDAPVYQRRSQNFDNLTDRRWSPFDDPSILKASRPREGSRKQRRWAHLYEIMKNSDVTEEDLLLYIKKDSSFSLLINNPELLNMWYRFTKASETAQAAYLRKIDQKTSHKSNKPTNIRGPPTADQCFQRIERSIRKLLKKSNIPYGLVSHLENSVIQFLMSENEYDFCDISSKQESDDEFDFCEPRPAEKSLLVFDTKDAFARMIGHALCQYYGLTSKSEGEGEERVLKAYRKKGEHYYPPPTRMSVYLSRQPTF